MEENKEESESTVRNSRGEADVEVSEALKGKGENDVGSSFHLSLHVSGPLLGEDLEAYVLQPAMRDGMVQCLISRDKQGVDKGMFPFYYLYLEAAEGQKVSFGCLGSKRHLAGSSPALCCVRSNLPQIQALLITELGPAKSNSKTYPSQN